MSSTIFYKFKSQKDTSRILFDGTGITVFDLKRDIIQENRLGDGTDFQLRLYNPDTLEEYEDDSYVIPRSSSVIARRSPAVKLTSTSGAGVSAARASMGNATRYVMGKPRVMRGNAPSTANSVSTTATANTAGVNQAVTEEDRIANMFANQESQWQQTQQEMSQATPVFNRPTGPSSVASGHDDAPPPPGYMCYRCGGRDHWIKNCPTNSDPNFEGKRIRRTTGIPKKFLKTVEVDPSTMTPEEMAQRKIMVTDDGSFVVQIADQQSWEDYQRKQQAVIMSSKDAVWAKGHFQDLPEDLKCPLTGGLLRDPVKTSKCCNKYFSKVALEDILVESDFVCPECGAKDVLLDSLIPDEEKKKQVQEFLDTHGVKRGGEQEVEDTSSKKAKVEGQPAMPVPPPFGIPPFPMFPMPFIPGMPPPPSGSNGTSK